MNYRRGETCLGTPITLKTVLIFPQESHCRGCWYPLSHNALLHGSPSVPLTSSTLAVGK